MGVAVIDMKNIDGGDREVIMGEIAKPCESTGFFQLLNNAGIEHELMDGVKKVCREHYKLNREQSFNDSLPARLLTNALDSDFILCLQLLNHGIENELMNRVKKVCSEHYKLNREESFNDSLPVSLLTNA
ncbi:hypothetical protein SUGI_0565330 [Cryptomeria japonica]|uniref:1-aminocyclopropane-1-carboxylate oxidase-like n=1 Tax=Cryptomeria japonica TaxID=3369 RepID=UPI0024089AB1|nr:1-aminocyclopropane-1-carboxylate oxidase-like [Cryptomeria japonica]GLJ28686.1 hypothetical protein SUGI_0565330 [Cryptomeria japonica]